MENNRERRDIQEEFIMMPRNDWQKRCLPNMETGHDMMMLPEKLL
jgi:hypothetical protein